MEDICLWNPVLDVDVTFQRDGGRSRTSKEVGTGEQLYSTNQCSGCGQAYVCHSFFGDWAAAELSI